METYKTIKTTGKEKEVQAFEDQYGDICVIVVIEGVEYALTAYEDETAAERKSDFLSEYGSTENSIKAIELMSALIANDYSKEEVIAESIEIELSQSKCNEITFKDFQKMNKFDAFSTDCSKNQVIMRMTCEQFDEVIDLLENNESVSIIS